MSILTFDEKNFYLDDAPFRIIAGDIHYFRIPTAHWERTLELAVDFGLNTVQTYIPWNAHEPAPGTFDFSGMLDLGRYLELCSQKGLKVLLRPSPYICSEWDLGGLPAWLLKDRELVVRSSDARYLKAVEEYYARLIPVFLPYLSTNDGPVIAVAVENEYGSYGNDRQYLSALADMLRRGGVDVPLYTTDGDCEQMLTFGRFDDRAFFGVNYRALPNASQQAYNAAKQIGADKPFFIGEFWSGRSMHWGEPFYRRPPAETAEAFREALELGGHICFYMFAGGTNFGFMGGANIGRSYSPRPGTPLRYIPHTTSYDVDALIGEDGTPHEKYFLCRDVLDEYLGKKKRERRCPASEKQSGSIVLTETASLFENLDSLTEKQDFSLVPRPMEDHGQNYGLILYSTALDAFRTQQTAISPSRFRDRATIFVDGEFLATFTRDRGMTKIADGLQNAAGMPLVQPTGLRRKIDVLVENTGRVNFSAQIAEERKGLEGALSASNALLYGYETRTLPLNDLSRLSWHSHSFREHLPCFFKGFFAAQKDIDTYVDFSNFSHGYIWINGFNLGRYDSAGPQLTLYVPGSLLNDENNEIIVLDIDPTGCKNSIALLNHAFLEGDAAELT